MSIEAWAVAGVMYGCVGAFLAGIENQDTGRMTWFALVMWCAIWPIAMVYRFGSRVGERLF